MRSLSLFSLLFLFISSCEAGDQRIKEASSLVQAALEKNQRQRYLKTTTTTSSSSGACTNTGSTEAACCVTDVQSENVCCDGKTVGGTNKLTCTVKDLKFAMTGCAGTQCATCEVQYLKSTKQMSDGTTKNKYKDCQFPTCYTCPDGEISYKCLNYDFQGCN